MGKFALSTFFLLATILGRVFNIMDPEYYQCKSTCGNYELEIESVSLCDNIEEPIIELNDVRVKLEKCIFRPEGQLKLNRQLEDQKIIVKTEGSIESTNEFEYGCASMQQVNKAPAYLVKRLILTALGLFPIDTCPIISGIFQKAAFHEEDLEMNRDKIEKLIGNLTLSVRVYDDDEDDKVIGCIEAKGCVKKIEPEAPAGPGR